MSGNIKKLGVGISVAILVFIAVVELGPFYAIHQIRQGLVQQDAARLASAVDFPALKANIKVQLEGFLAGQSPTDIKKKPFAAFAMSFASKVVDGMVDAVVSPQGLAALLHGINPSKSWQTKGSKSAETTAADSGDILKDATYRFDSPNQFSVWINGEGDSRFQFIFIRTGLSWKLSNVIFPVHP